MAEISEETYKIFETAYAFFNARLFEGALPKCLITFQRQSRLMGYVSFNRWKNKQHESIDELAINPEYFANFPLTEILQTLCHEMTHVWQAHFGSPTRNGYHNQEWSRKMISLGLMPSSTGKPGGKTVGQGMLDYVIEGGLFESAVKDIIREGFELIWFDTVSIIPKPPSQTASKNVSLSSVPADTLSVSSNHVKEIDLGVDMDAFTTAIEQSLLSDLPCEIVTSRPKKASSKTKYYCTNCFSQVWGKTGLNIVCGTCIKPYIQDT
ncbi:MAG: hypothetical protein ACJAZ7_000770 [Zhongshania aliphaticivorans]|jgi:predicted SprT family Zn-dependent metalloprotease